MNIHPSTSAYERKMISRWTAIANDVLGSLAFNLGLASASTDNPRFFAWVSIAFVLAAGLRLQRPYQGIFHLWREMNHPFVGLRFIWKKYRLFIFGWTFLGLVALDLVNKNGPSIPSWAYELRTLF